MYTTKLQTTGRALPQNREPCICTALRSLTRRTTAIYDRFLEPTGLTQPQYTVLARLDGLVHCSLGELAKVCDLDVTSLSRGLRPLIGAGLIRAGLGKDNRTKRYELTIRGKQVLRKAYRQWQKAQARVRSVVTAEHVQTIDRLSTMLVGRR